MSYSRVIDRVFFIFRRTNQQTGNYAFAALHEEIFFLKKERIRREGRERKKDSYKKRKEYVMKCKGTQHRFFQAGEPFGIGCHTWRVS